MSAAQLGRMNVNQPTPYVLGATVFDFPAWQEIDFATIPRLRFVYGDAFAAGYFSVTFAAPKVGKSLLNLAEAVDAATGRGFLTGRPAEPIKVLYYNAEDDLSVIQGRIGAILGEYEIPQSEIAGRLFPVSGVNTKTPVVLIKGEKGEIVESTFRGLANLIKANGITLAIFDPLQDLSESPETNEVFRPLGKRIREFASETGAAIGFVHHTRKATNGVQATMDDARGGGALRGLARFNRLLVPMTEAEGANAGVDDFRRYFRIGEMESNLAPPSSERNQWFEKLGHKIANGENVAVMRPWTWPEAFSGVTVNDACRVRSAIAAREIPPRKDVQAKDWAGHIVADVLGLDTGKKADKARVSAMLKKWIETDVLRVESVVLNEKNRRAVDCLFIGPNNPAETFPDGE